MQFCVAFNKPLWLSRKEIWWTCPPAHLSQPFNNGLPHSWVRTWGVSHHLLRTFSTYNFETPPFYLHLSPSVTLSPSLLLSINPLNINLKVYLRKNIFCTRKTQPKYKKHQFCDCPQARQFPCLLRFFFSKLTKKNCCWLLWGVLYIVKSFVTQ